MASKIIYPVIAAIGIAVASGTAWWYQSKPKPALEVTASAGSGNAPNSAIQAGAPTGSASSARPYAVEIAKVERAPLQDDAQAVGSLRSRQSVMVRPEVAGRIKLLGFTDGARVRKGQVLVQLDDVLQRAEIQQAMAQVSIAQANFKRNQELVAQSFVAQRVLEESAANLQVVQAQLTLACARWSRMTVVAPFDGTVGLRVVNLGDYVKDGADLVNLEDIGSMYVDFRLPERLQGKLRLQQPVELTLDAFPGRTFKAKIEAIDPLLDVNGRSVGVRALLPNTMGESSRDADARGGPGPAKAGPVGPVALTSSAPTRPAASAGLAREQPQTRPVATVLGGNGCSTEAAPVGRDEVSATPTGRASGATRAGGSPGSPGSASIAPLRPGMFARVNTVFSVNEAALVLPEEAIVPQGGRQFVIKVVAPEAVPSVVKASLPADTQFVSLRQEVKLGVRRQGKVEVTEGVVEGDTVVLAGQQRLQRDGTPLRVVEMGRPAQGAASAPMGNASRPAAPQ